MAVAKLISPGVFTKENDLSTIPQGIAAIGAAIVGLTQKGPAFVPTRVSSYGEFQTIFGATNPQLYTPYAAKNYLANSNALTVTRLLSKQDCNLGYPIFLQFPDLSLTGITGATALTSSTIVLAMLRTRNNTQPVTATVTGTAASFSLNVNGSMIHSLSLDKTSPNYIKKILGTDPQRAKSGDQLPSVYVDAVFDYAYASSTGTMSATSSGSGWTLGNFSTAVGDKVTGGYVSAYSPMIVSQGYNGAVYDLFRCYSRSDGEASNTDVKVSIYMDKNNLTVSSFPYFTVFVRAYGDTDRNPVILESFRCNLDPNSQSFIGRAIGDRYVTVDVSTDPATLRYEGQYSNNSKYIRVATQTNGQDALYPPSARPSGFSGIVNLSITSTLASSTGLFRFNHVNDITNSTDDKMYMGFRSDLDGAADRLKGSVVSNNATKSTDKGLLIFPLSSEFVNISSTSTLATSYMVIPSWGIYGPAYSSVTSQTQQRVGFTVPLYGGTDSIDPRLDKREAINGSLSTEYTQMINLLANADEYDFNLIALPGVNAGNVANGNVPQKVLDMVADRGDAFYIMDIADAAIASTSGAVDSTIAGITEVIKGYDSSYGATYFPWVRIYDGDSQRFIWVPPSVDVLGVYGYNDRVGQQFFAPAGFNRGIMTAVEARYRLNIAQRDSLYDSRINPIGTFSGQGPVVWGQKTLQIRASALDRVNVRRLLILAKKLVASVAKYYAFEPNTAKVRTNLVNNINPILDRIRQQQGIDQFKVVIDETLNTPDIIDRNTLIGKIYIVPTRTAEILSFEFNILNSGATLFGA